MQNASFDDKPVWQNLKYGKKHDRSTQLCQLQKVDTMHMSGILFDSLCNHSSRSLGYKIKFHFFRKMMPLPCRNKLLKAICRWRTGSLVVNVLLFSH